jgi:CRP-like cAMP-binding protein
MKTAEINHEGHEGHEEFASRQAIGCHTIVTWQISFVLCSLCTPMNPAELFRQESGALQLAPGDFLFKEGDKGEKMYVLLEGEVDIIFGDHVLEAVKAGALIGEMALIDDSPRVASVMAKTPCRLAEIDRRRFHFLVQQTPHFATHVMRTLADRLRHMNAVAASR